MRTGIETDNLALVSQWYQMLDVLADFEWYREPKGHRIVAFGSLTQGSPWKRSSAHDDVPWITPNGRADDVRKYKPFERGGDLCAAFAAVRTPQALLRFVNDHGLLTWGGVPVSRHKDDLLATFPAGEPVPLGLTSAEMFRELRQLQAAGDLKKLGLHFQSKIAGFVGGGQVGQVEIVPDLEKGLRLKVTPPTLLGALWYQLTLKLSDVRLRTCPLCHRVFEVGHGTGLRADATFCCREHKLEYFNRTRRSRSRQ